MHDSKLALNVKEQRRALGDISPPTYYKLVASGELKTFTIGRRRYATPEACRAYIQQREKDAK